jgi:ATP-dependent Lhr-like helicase
VELCEEVSRLREDISARLPDRAAAAEWLRSVEGAGIAQPLAEQLVDYLSATRAALGAVPSMQTVVAERFFDEAGGMQLVIHAPFGARLNRAWGLALRKRFCRSFNFELQAAATDDGIVLSLGQQHSFPLESVFGFLRPHTVREILVQAALQAPMFGTRWRWNATRALAVLRYQGGRKVPPPLQRMRAEDVLAAVFPAQVGCQDNQPGDIEPVDHPLVNQTLRDCLEEAMDTEALIDVLERLDRGDIRCIARDTPEPSPMSHAILNANPYAYLDDAPLEERRTRAVTVRRGLPADVASELGALDADAIATVRRDAAPFARDPDELHDVLCLVGALLEHEAPPGSTPFLEQLIAARRATRVRIPDSATPLWVAAERLLTCRAAYGAITMEPIIAAAPGVAEPTREEAVLAIVRGRMEHGGPVTEEELATALALPQSDVAIACARLESDGSILRGRFTPGRGEDEWCDRRLLSRIHRLTIGRLRREIEPVPPADFMRYLLRWHHLAPGSQLHGEQGLLRILAQLQGAEAAVGAWERDVLPARVAGYAPALLDELALSGDIVWGRRSTATASITTRATPIALWLRAPTPWMLGAREPDEPSDGAGAGPAHEAATIVEAALRGRGALFHAELLQVTGLMTRQLDDALWALVAGGRVTADGFGALRTLAAESPRRTGRWSLLRSETTLPAIELAEQHARQLLARHGVVYREIVRRELLPPWRDLLQCYRRLEARGEIRGGRFVAGVVGEQFALPEAVETLRLVRRQEGGTPIPTSRDPILLRTALFNGGEEDDDDAATRAQAAAEAPLVG